MLVNALSLGADPGSVWGIYPEGETAFDPGKAQAFAVVKSMKNQDAVAVISPKQAKVSSNGRAVLVAPAAESKAIPVVTSERSTGASQTIERIVGEANG